MRQVVLRGLLAHKTRLAATFVAVALGVAFVSGVLTLTDTMNRTFDDLFATAYEGTDAVVRSDRTMSSDFDGERRASIPESVLEQVRGVDSVAVAEGQVEGYARIIDPDGDPVGNPAFGAPTLGGNWTEDDDLNALDLRRGRAPERAGEIMLDAASARSTGYEVGDEVPVQTKEGVSDYEMVGVASFGTADSPGGASYVVFTTPEAQKLLGEAEEFNTIAVVAADGATETDLVRDIRAAFEANGGGEVEVLSGTAIVEESQSDLRSELAFVTNFFLTFAVIAVVVGSFVIYNSFSIVVAQRTREMALLRAVGASRAQVRRAVLLEAAVVGLVGAAAGFVLGLGIATGLAGFMDVDGGLAILPTSVVIALAVGVVVTLVSALLPARRASKVPPIAAMRSVEVDTSGRSRVRFAVGLGLLALGVAGVVAGANAPEVSTVGLGVAGTFLGLLVAGPGLARPVGAALGWPLGRTRGIAGVLARENARRNPRRSASTAQALMIGVGIVAFFMVINASIRASIDKTLEDNFTGDLIVDSGSFGMVGIPHDVAQQIGEMPEVEGAAPMRYNIARIGDGTVDVLGTTSDVFPIMGNEVVDGSGALGDDEIVVRKELADKNGLSVGDVLTFEFLDTGLADLTVAGIYDGPQASEVGDYILSVDELAAHVDDDTDQQVMVVLKDGTSLADTKARIEKITDPLVTPEVQTVDDFKDTIGGQLDVFLNLVLGLLLLAIVIALLGIANTVALSVLERTRELGLLRAVGMSRRQLRSAIRWESVIIALFGTSLGLAVGVLGGWGMVTAFKDEGFEVFQIPFGVLATVSVIAAACGMAAAVVPAWRASRLDVLDAIHTE